jgi:hypothetical protein
MTTATYYAIELLMEDGKYISWEGDADDQNHAEGLAIAYATEKTSEQVDSIYEIVEFETISEHEATERYDDMLDECNGDIDIMGMKYCTSRVLKEVDPIAYNCGFSDFCSSLCEDNIHVEGF